LSTELHVSDYLPRICVDQRGDFAVVIPGINQIQFAVVNDGIRVEARGNLLQELERTQIEHGNGVVFAVARESEVAVGDDSNAVHALHARGRAGRLSARRIDYTHEAMAGIASVEPLPFNRQVIDECKAQMERSRHFDRARRPHKSRRGPRRQVNVERDDHKDNEGEPCSHQPKKKTEPIGVKTIASTQRVRPCHSLVSPSASSGVSVRLPGLYWHFK
jgi:hypothetical protein